ncbi:hypothetical protein FGIG_01046 [Fasciola gigantica]|uniref:Uncharacterized protein n=1 Tax=Fasciola gigantica TaxID=46835 RepID=A0A504Y8J5_FASGI|nr:hypothetical protein FGIG_01046 [Fasciola gigantica]
MDPVVAEIAIERCTTLQNERAELEETRRRFEKEHNEAELEAKRLQNALILKTSSTEERDMITLLIRSHQLELERADLDARYAISDTELKKREFLLDQLRQDNLLSDAIIRYQCTLLENNKVERPRELEHLLELYDQQGIGNAGRRVSLTGSSMDFRMIALPFTNGLQTKASVSLSSLPTDNGLIDNRYSRTAKWLEHYGSRRASYADLSPDFHLGSPHTTVHKQQQQQSTSKVQDQPIRCQSTLHDLDDTNKYTLQLVTPIFVAKHSSEDSNSSSSDVIRTRNADFATKAISAVAQKRKTEKMKEKRLGLGKPTIVDKTQINNPDVNAVTNPDCNTALSVIGENPSSLPSVRGFGLASTPTTNEADPWPLVAGSRISIETHKLPDRRPGRPIRTDGGGAERNRPDSISRCSTHTDSHQTDTGVERQQYPLTKAVKVPTMELRAQKMQTNLRTTKNRENEMKSGIPRSRSTPRPVQQKTISITGKNSSPILQAPQLVRINDHQGCMQTNLKHPKVLPKQLKADYSEHSTNSFNRRRLREMEPGANV